MPVRIRLPLDWVGVIASSKEQDPKQGCGPMGMSLDGVKE